MENKVLSQLRMIIFDVDGTLAETDDYYVDKSTALIRKILPFMSAAGIGKVIRPVINTGETIVHSFYRLLDTVGLDTVVSKIHSRASVKESYKYELIEGTVETLEIQSKKYKLGIITSGHNFSRRLPFYQTPSDAAAGTGQTCRSPHFSLFDGWGYCFRYYVRQKGGGLFRSGQNRF